MKKVGIGLVLAGIVGCSASSDDAQAPAGLPSIELGGKTLNLTPAGSGGVGSHVVLYRSESIPADAANKIAKAGGKLVSTIPSLGIALVSGPASFDAKIKGDGNVLASAPEHRVYLPKSHVAPVSVPPPDFLFPLQWDIRRVNAPAAWEHVPGYGSTKVAVIDSGVMSDHPDFDPGQVSFSKTYAHCVVPPAEVQSQILPPGTPLFAQERDGYPEYGAAIVLDERGIFPPGCYFGIGMQYQDHGTHVAGTVGANVNAQSGVVGVAPGVSLLAYKVFERIITVHPDNTASEGFGADDFNIFRAIDDAVSKGASVINMSLGSVLNREDEAQNAHYLMWDRVVRSASRRGTLVVAAAGNENMTNNGEMAFVPSDLTSVISVGATGTSTVIGPQGLDALPGSDVRAEYSNVGAAVDIVAPGGDCGPGGFNPQTCNVPNLIFSSIIVPVGYPDPNVVPGQPWWAPNAGTSMASPHVAGAAALVRAKHPGLTPAQVKARLQATAQAIGPRQQFGAGIVDAAAATAN